MSYEECEQMTARIAKIYRYPVKGLSPDPLERASLTSGRTLAGDRRFALALASTRFDGRTAQWQPKSSFLMLAKHEKLAALDTRFDDTGTELTVFRNNRQVARGKLTDPVGRAIIEDFFAAYMGADTHGKPHLADAGEDINFTDQKDALISIINLASIRDLERIVGTELDPERFRANVYVDGIDPWSEFSWVGQNIATGDALLSVVDKTNRCGAINVNPKDGARDQNLVKALQAGFGHVQMGIFASVTTAGSLAIGETVGPTP